MLVKLSDFLSLLTIHLFHPTDSVEIAIYMGITLRGGEGEENGESKSGVGEGKRVWEGGGRRWACGLWNSTVSWKWLLLNYSSYIFTCACIWATFISATFIASFILEFLSAAILCSEFTSSSWVSSSFRFLHSSASTRSFLPFSDEEMTLVVAP